MKDVVQIIVGGPLLAFIAVLFTWIGIYHGQWFSSNLLGRGKAFRQGTSKSWIWLSFYWIPCFGFLRPVIRGAIDERSLLEIVQRSPDCTVAIGSVLVGAIIGYRSSKPVGLILVIITTCLIAPLAWLLMIQPAPALRWPIFICYCGAVAAVTFNFIAWIRSRNSSKHIVEDAEEIENAGLRGVTLSLLKDGQLLSKSPAIRKWKHAEVRFPDSSVLMHAYCRANGVYFYAMPGVEGLDPLAPGAEYVPVPVVWLFVPWENLETLKTERIIGYNEVSLRLKNSGLQLRLEGVSRKQLSQFDSVRKMELVVDIEL